MSCSVPDPFKILPKRMLQSLLKIGGNYFWMAWCPSSSSQGVSDTLVGNGNLDVNKPDINPSSSCMESSPMSIWVSGVNPALSWEI